MGSRRDGTIHSWTRHEPARSGARRGVLPNIPAGRLRRGEGVNQNRAIGHTRVGAWLISPYLPGYSTARKGAARDSNTGTTFT